jgi:putative transcriptional regulator
MVRQSKGQERRYALPLLLGGFGGQDSDAHGLQQERKGGPDQRSTENAKETGAGGIRMKKELFQELMESVRQGGRILRGERKPSRAIRLAEPDVRKIRRAYGLSQQKFAALMGISIATLRNWEQGRRRPQGAARVLLRIAAKHPQAVLDSVA